MQVAGLAVIRASSLPRHAGVLRGFRDARSVAGASSTSEFCPGRDGLANGGLVDHNM